MAMYFLEGFIVRARFPLTVLCGILLSRTDVSAQIISGTITGSPSTVGALPFGDGTHSVLVTWSGSSANKGFFYGSSYNGNTDVAVASGVTDISEITNASQRAFTTRYTGLVSDAQANGGIGQFVVFRNITNGFYGVLRVDDIYPGTNAPLEVDLSATWWFQSDGGPNFGPDMDAPRLTVTSPTNSQIVTTANIMLSGTATDQGQGENGISELTINNAALANATVRGSSTLNWSNSVALSSGTNVLDIIASDYAGNTADLPLSVVYWPAVPVLLGVGSAPPLSSTGFNLTITGPTGFTYEIQHSADLRSWISITDLFMTSSPMRYEDVQATNAPRQFYRALVK